MKLFATLLALTMLPAFAADFNLVGREVSRLLQNGHYARLAFDRDFSARIFDDYLEDLDPERLYFTQQDVAELSRKYRRELNELIDTEQSMKVAGNIYARYQKRVKERVAIAQELLGKREFDVDEFTFDSDRSVPRDRKDLPWPRNDVDAAIQWKLKLESLLLSEILHREEARKRAREQGKDDPFSDQPAPREKLIQQYERILQNTERATNEDIANYFFSAVARAHDPHTEYLSALEESRFSTRLSNKLVGIGATLNSENDGTTRITGIISGGPADKAGDLKLDDRIIGIDPLNQGKWVDTRFMPIEKVIGLIKGESNTKVGLRIESDVPREITIERGLVKIKSDLTTSEIFVFGEGDPQFKVGLLQVPSFYFDNGDRSRNVSVHVKKILQRMMKENIEGLLIDMRNNGGGSLDEVSRMTGLFIGRGPVVQVKDSNGQITALNSRYRKPIYTGPIVLLINKGSASATEIFAAALQDYNRAVIVGASSSFGKGTVQTPTSISRYMPLFSDSDRAGTLKYTVQKYYRASGGSVQLRGVVPDIILPSASDAYEVGEKFAKHALPFDIIRKAKGLRPFNKQHLFLPDLKTRSTERIKTSQDFAYTLEDIARNKKRREENRESLNIEIRRAEIAANEQRRKKRNAERRFRYAAMEKEDAKLFTAYRLTLDDLKTAPLSPVNRDADKNRYIRRSKNKFNDLNDAPELPSGLDKVKREGLAILKDFINLSNNSRTAGLLHKS